MERLICLAVGYVFGLFQTGYLYGRMNGIDIRQYGSGNSGTTNALRVLGKKAGLVVFAGDFLKTLIPCLTVRYIFREHMNSGYLFMLYTGLGVILGHNFPCYLKFKGGKGIAATAGLLAALDLRLGFLCLFVFVAIVAVSRYVSLGSLVISLIFFIWNVCMAKSYGIPPECILEYDVLAGIICAMAFWRHRSNISRLLHGTENKLWGGKNKQKRSVVDMASIGVIGSGTWGTALSILLAGNGHQVDLWSALENEVTALSRTRVHPNLPKVRIPESIHVTGNLKKAMEEKDILVLSVPSVFVRQTAGRMKEFLKPGQVIVNVAKGIEEGSLMTLSQVIEEELPGCQVAALSGPSHAEEVSLGLPTTCVAGAHKRHVAELVQSVFMSSVFRVYTNPDLLGIELGGALKNVIALAAGIADGLGFGDNTKAALITRGIAEISRLGMAMGGKAETFAGLTGIGDLIVTCASMHSRNRRAGILIGQGLSMEEAMKEVHMVVEGVYSAKAARALAEKYGVSMPIVEQVNEVLFDGLPAGEAVTGLMLRDKCTENPSMEWEEG